MQKEDIVATYDTLYACDINEIKKQTIEEYEKQQHYERIIRERKRRKIEEKQKEKRKYFLNQKLIGIFFLIVTLIFTFTINFAFIVGIVISVGIITTKKMVIVNDYWRTHGGFEQWHKENEDHGRDF